VADGIIFERLGIPTASIVTDAFTQSSDTMARLQGAPGYRYVSVPHPLSNLSEAECDARAAEILPDVLSVLGLDRKEGSQLSSHSAPSSTQMSAHVTASPHVTKVAVDELVRIVEHYYEQEWTDGLPVVPVSPEMVDAFLEVAGLGRDDPLLCVEHLERTCTAELGAVAAAMAGCRPEHYPVVVAVARALQPLAATGLLQSTTGQAVCIVVNGPIRNRLGFNAAGNVLGPGYRANATVGRAIRLITMNALGVRPGAFDQSTQGTPGKYCLCVAENEEASPFEPLHAERGFRHDESVVTVHFARSTLAVENRTSSNPEAVLLTIADARSYVGASGCRAATVLLGPEHAHLLARNGWDRAMVKQFLFEHWGRTRTELERFGLEGGDGLTGAFPEGDADFVHFGDGPESVLLVVAGAASPWIRFCQPVMAAEFWTIFVKKIPFETTSVAKKPALSMSTAIGSIIPQRVPRDGESDRDGETPLASLDRGLELRAPAADHVGDTSALAAGGIDERRSRRGSSEGRAQDARLDPAVSELHLRQCPVLGGSWMKAGVEDEIAEAVEDESRAVALDPSQGVGVRAGDHRRSSIDERMGDLSLVLVHRRAHRDSEVQVHHDEVDLLLQLSHLRTSALELVRVRPGVHERRRSRHVKDPRIRLVGGERLYGRHPG
jgi:hypothetical protein